MPKPKRLIDDLRASEPEQSCGPVSWWDKLKAKDASLMQQVDELIDAWNAGDEQLRAVRPSKYSLSKWLCEKVGLVSKPATVTRYINARAARGAQR